ncbi:MAG: riboflavin synthase [Fretibacterium sp.]|nr:riboflavin synthase [Fretibacterium sp.]
MFTGLVEMVGTVRAFQRTGVVYRLTVESPELAPELVLGQSVSVSGACLTVVAVQGDAFDVEMISETVQRTRFANLTQGTRLNLERALRLGDRLDGHLVQGHVDGIARLRELSSGAQTRVARFEAVPSLLRGIVPKGSVALDGVSLTVIEVTRTDFSVGLIPATLQRCTLGSLRAGDIVNLETDIIGKYVQRLMETLSSGRLSLSIEELTELGY